MAPSFREIVEATTAQVAEIELERIQRSMNFYEGMFQMATNKKPEPQDQAVRDLQRMAQLQEKKDRWWRKLRRCLTEVDKIEAAMKRVGKRKPAKEQS